MARHRIFPAFVVALVSWLPISVAAQSPVVLDITLSTPPAKPAVAGGLSLALSSPVGSATFSVRTTNGVYSGPVTVSTDTGHVPLPLVMSICPTNATTGACLIPAAATASITLTDGQAPTFSVVVTAMAPIPLDATFHRVFVRFTDATGGAVGVGSVAIGNGSYGRQIAISKGGIYSGNWSNDHFLTGEPGGGDSAVYVDTTEPVVLEHCFMRSTKSHVNAVPGAHLTIRNCRAYGADPGVAGAQRGYFLFAPSIGSLTMEHNYLDGMAWGAALWSAGNTGRWTVGGPIVIRYNQVRNLDGVSSDGRGGRITDINPNTYSNGFVSINQLNLVHGAEISWNEVINEPYVSATADLINLWASPGTLSQPVRIHNNFLRGQYAPVPHQGNGINSPSCLPHQPRCYNTYVAQVIVLDGNAVGETALTASSFIRIYQNQLVNTWGGITLTAGHDNEAYANRVVSTGRLRDGTWIAPAYSAGITVADNYHMGPTVFYNNSAHDNVVGFVLQRVSNSAPVVYVPPPIRSDYDFERSGCVSGAPALCFDNQSLPDPITVATEDQETVLWRQKLAVGGVAVGPMLPADCLFNWAERTLGQYFAPAGKRSEVLLGTPSYYYRYFSGTGNYLGVNLSDNHLYAVGPATAGNLVNLGPVAPILTLAGCQ